MKNILIFTVIFFAFLGNITAQVNLDSMLVAYYPFNGNAIDESGNGNNGTVYGAMLAHDRFGNENSAFWFNGISDFIEVPDSYLLDITSKISITGWMKKDSNVPWASMVTKGGATVDENNYTIHNSPGNGIIFTGMSDTSCISSWDININEWHFVSLTWDGNIAKIYIDGQADELSFVNYSGALTPNNSSLFIGVDPPGEIEFFHGYLDDIRIYNRGLNQEEILYLFEEGTVDLNYPSTNHFNNHLTVSPNPVNDFAFVTFQNPDNSKYTFSIFNSSGHKVFEKQNIQSDRIEFNRGILPGGVYIVELKSEKVFRGKMVVK
ncbi:MAG: T9SS type A sorting domain-containing protein [Sphingobacteriia bacterium]|nr:T9SS type A sorting domain-containing protein [Sphingobacteriia bacterium]